MISILERYKKLILASCLLIYVSFGVLTFRDFGMSYDEKVQREYGHANWSYVFENDLNLLDHTVRYHGPFFEMVLIGMEKALGLKDTRVIYQARHLAGFLFFVVGLIFFYLLAKAYFQDWKLAFLAALLMGLTPRILGEAFYNSKDIPFMVIFIVGLYTHLKFMDKRTWFWVFIHGLVCGLAMDIRIIGGLLVFFTLAQSAVEGSRSEKTWPVIKSLLIKLLSFLGITTLTMLLFWPVLWDGPIFHFIAGMKEMSRFPWPGVNVFLGQFVKGTEAPWYFTWVWMSVTVPVAYLFAFGLGLYATTKQVVKGFRAPSERFYRDLLWLICFFLPLALYVVMKSTLYGGWRHSYYLYPAFLILAINGIRWAYETLSRSLPKYKQWVLYTGLFGMLLVLFSNTYWIVRYHPYQYMFFNHVVGGLQGAKFKFQIDYWGGPFRQALEYILENDPSDKIRVFVRHKTGRFTRAMIKTEDRHRLIYVNHMEEADYFIGNYRYFNEEYRHPREMYAIHIAETKVMAVFKIKAPQDQE